MGVLDRFRLDGEVAVVTGGSSGIGRAAAHAMAEVGARIVLVDIDGERAQTAAKAMSAAGLEAESLSLDVADALQVAEIFGQIAKRHGRIDVLVNCAGISSPKPTLDCSVELWNRVLAVNLTGTFLCAQAAGRQMLQQAEGGRIVNVASTSAFSGGGFYASPAYKAAKAGVVNLTRALAIEWACKNVRVNGVAPSFTRSEMTRNLFEKPESTVRALAMTPLQRLGELDDLVGAFLYLASSASSWVTGQTLIVDGGRLAA
jgi:NAD(P)-dependent dehydrogenase (short-subunit alcohol dehydrogenase family)